MQLLPGTLAAPSKFRCGPFAFADDGQPSAVDDEMDGVVARHTIELDVEMLATPREGGVIGSFVIDAHQREY